MRLVIQRDQKSKSPCFLSTDFWNSDTPGPVSIHFDMRSEEWEKLGRPDQITVTIEPGDRLT